MDLFCTEAYTALNREPFGSTQHHELSLIAAVVSDFSLISSTIENSYVCKIFSIEIKIFNK